MVFYLLCFLLCFFLAFALSFFLTRKSLSNWNLEGPRSIGERLASRNQAVLFVVLALLVVVGFFEVIIQDFSYWLQDLQVDALNVLPPEWAIVIVGSGSISWLFYVAILLGTGLGLIFGTSRACKPFGVLSGLKWLDFLVGPRASARAA